MSICSKQLVGCLLDFGLPVLDHKPTVFLGMCRFDYPVCPAARQDLRLGEEALAMDLESNASELQYTKEKTWFKGDQTTTRKWNPESCSSLAFGMWSVDRNVVETRRQVKPCARLPPRSVGWFLDGPHHGIGGRRVVSKVRWHWHPRCPFWSPYKTHFGDCAIYCQSIQKDSLHFVMLCPSLYTFNINHLPISISHPCDGPLSS